MYESTNVFANSHSSTFDSQMCNDQPRLPSIAYVSLEESQRYAEATVKGSFGLSPAEKFWRDHQPHLQSREYVLRARYRPNWRPSWLGTNLDPTYCEDSIMVSVSNSIIHSAITCLKYG